jgi:mRNA interferase HigB
MKVIRIDRLVEFGQTHADAADALAAWLQTVEAVTWRNPAEVRQTWGSTDVAVPVSGGRRVAVFNIKGNHYRLVASIDYRSGIVNVLRVMTHKEYDRDKWKESV